MLGTVGERPLGIQAGQLAAVARWARAEYKDDAVSLHATGPRSSLATLVAAALEPSIADADLGGSFASLKEVLEQIESLRPGAVTIISNPS